MLMSVGELYANHRRVFETFIEASVARPHLVPIALRKERTGHRVSMGRAVHLIHKIICGHTY